MLRMKRMLLLLLGAAMMIGSLDSCKKKRKPNLTIPFPYTKSKTLPAIDTPFNVISLPIEMTDTFATKVDEFLSIYGQGTTRSQIVSLTPDYMEVLVDAGTSQTFNFVDDSVKVFVDAYNGTNPILVAYKKGIPANSTKIAFDIIRTDIKELFNNPYMQVTLKFNTKPNEKILAGSMFTTNFGFAITVDPN